MLWFAGLGVSGLASAPARTLELMGRADAVYLEGFTSPVADAGGIREACGGRLREARRWMVEDGRRILEEAASGEVVLVSYGDPYVATTHIELRTRAEREGIRTGTVHASSALTSVVGECGLHHYRVGRIATVMADAGSHATPYDIIYRNMVRGDHSVLLLEYDQDGGSFLSPGAALGMLRAAEVSEGRGAVTGGTFAIVASRVGLGGQAIAAGAVSELEGRDYGPPPHTVIIPGRLHFTESDALRVLAECSSDPRGNSDDVPGAAVQMLEKYVPMVRGMLAEVEPLYAGRAEFAPVLENARLYVADAERFLADGRDEVAVLSIGYADGLVDALRIAAGLGPRK